MSARNEIQPEIPRGEEEFEPNYELEELPDYNGDHNANSQATQAHQKGATADEHVAADDYDDQKEVLTGEELRAMMRQESLTIIEQTMASMQQAQLQALQQPVGALKAQLNAAISELRQPVEELQVQLTGAVAAGDADRKRFEATESAMQTQLTNVSNAVNGLQLSLTARRNSVGPQLVTPAQQQHPSQPAQQLQSAQPRADAEQRET